MKKKYSAAEDEYLIKNSIEMSYTQMTKEMKNRSRGSIAQRLEILRRNKLVGFKQIRSEESNSNEFVGSAYEVKMKTKGEESKLQMAGIRSKIRPGIDVKIQFDVDGRGKNGFTKTEKCKVMFKTFNYFTVQREHYLESFNFVDVLTGHIAILV